jgi:hypothetical protein
MAHGTVSKIEESSHEQIKNQDNGPFFFLFCEVVHKEFATPSVTLTQKYYFDVLDHLRKRVMRVQMEIADNRILPASSRQCTCTHSAVSL